MRLVAWGSWVRGTLLELLALPFEVFACFEQIFGYGDEPARFGKVLRCVRSHGVVVSIGGSSTYSTRLGCKCCWSFFFYLCFLGLIG